MIASCIKVRSSELADHQRGRFDSIDEKYPITVGASYVVAGMGIWETTLYVLIRDDDGLPTWCPAGLFAIPAQPIPTNWEMALDEGIYASGRRLWTKWVARWGYRELIHDPHHNEALLERDRRALSRFRTEIQRLGQEHGEKAVAGPGSE